MPARGTKPTEGPKRFRGAPQIDWTEVEDRPYVGKVPVRLAPKRTIETRNGPKSVPLQAATKNWWKTIRRMPHCVLWSDSDWHFALGTALVADNAFRGATAAAAELRQREKVLGVTVDSRRDLRIRYVKPDPKHTGSHPAGSTRKKRAKKGGTVTSLDDRRRRLSSGDAS